MSRGVGKPARRGVVDGSIVWSGWPRIATTIKRRALAPGEPLRLVAIDANLPLDEDSDEEAYRWLALMVVNVEREEGVIEAF